MDTVLTVLTVVTLVLGQDTRDDGLCGPGNRAASGVDAKCDHIPPFPTCCQNNGHCGWDCDNVQAAAPDAARPAVVAPVRVAAPPAAVFTSTGLYRSDGKCGPLYPLEGGAGAECDPNSEYWCCSEHGFCGGTQEHCFCDTCVNYRPVDLLGKVRSDRRCGQEFPLADGLQAECDGTSGNPCCSKHGYCGPGPDHCGCAGCVDYRGGVAKQVAVLVGRVRVDRRCGTDFPLPDGQPAECEGAGDNPCCSKWGYCGPGDAHCACPSCADYRTSDQKLNDWEGRWRRDRRCGPDFPLPDGSGPTECDPDSDKFCCSKWGFCGGDGEHCGCEDCVNYLNINR
eukprot:GFUD01003144.1.p1 GENE.GFUD01003144.1~~GFUD01003144.1.p1  ORF type:complete len:339 (+),score=94.64 GFUD01003144.1:521-1537(+)